MSEDGLEYVDDQGCRCTIDFHTCRENFKKKHVPERLWARVSDYVAVRDIEAKPPHITLATNPPTRFLFPLPGPGLNDGARSAALEPIDFYEFDRRLFGEAGVRTFDVT